MDDDGIVDRLRARTSVLVRPRGTAIKGLVMTGKEEILDPGRMVDDQVDRTTMLMLLQGVIRLGWI